MKITTTFVRRVLLVTRNLESIPNVPDVGTEFKLRRLQFPQDWEAFREFRPEVPVRRTRQRIDQGHECYAVWHANKIAHAGWAATGPVRIEYLHLDYVPEKAEVFLFDTYTRSEYRRLYLSRARSCYQARDYLQRGYTHSAGIVALENKVAISTTEALGYTVRSQMISVGLGPFRLVHSKAMPEYK